jgi:hypothetical protein
MCSDITLAEGTCNCLLQFCQDRFDVYAYHGHQTFAHDLLVDHGQDYIHEDRNLGTVIEIHGQNSQCFPHTALAHNLFQVNLSALFSTSSLGAPAGPVSNVLWSCGSTLAPCTVVQHPSLPSSLSLCQGAQRRNQDLTHLRKPPRQTTSL